MNLNHGGSIGTTEVWVTPKTVSQEIIRRYRNGKEEVIKCIMKDRNEDGHEEGHAITVVLEGNRIVIWDINGTVKDFPDTFSTKKLYNNLKKDGINVTSGNNENLVPVNWENSCYRYADWSYRMLTSSRSPRAFGS